MMVSHRDRKTMVSAGRLERTLSLVAMLLLRFNGFLVASAFSPTPLPFRTRSTAISTSRPLTSLPSSVVELTDPETGCQVLLLGCFHGSNSSAADVLKIVDADTDVVVLELCASRFADLRRDYLMASSSSFSSSSDLSSLDINSDKVPIKKKRPWILRYASTAVATSRESGIGAGLAFAVLGGVSGLQASLSGLVPGLEFTAALQAATEVNADIVLADQVVEETLNNIGNLPKTSFDMWLDFIQTGNWHETFGKEAAALQTAIAGNSEFQPQQLTLPAFLTRSRISLEEGIRSTVPPFLLLQLFVASANMAAERLVLNPAVATAAFAADSASVTLPLDSTTTESLALAAFNFALLAIGYITVALPAARVVLRERDERLTAGIKQACRLAVQENSKNSTPKVVAVLGLLHVNGVAQRLLSSSAPPPPPQTGAMNRDLLEKDTAPRIFSRDILGNTL